MEVNEIEQRINEELNSPELIQKFMLLAREKGFRYHTLDFTNVRIAQGKVCITVEAK